MKNISKLSFFIFFAFSLLFTSCFRTKNNSKLIIKDTIIDFEKTYADYIKSCKSDTVDYSKIKISRDSLDYELYILLCESNIHSQTKLIEKIETLINAGANPNAVIEYSYDKQRIGSYIPIVKKLYKNKYKTRTEYVSLFQMAVGNGNIMVVKKILEKGADINLPTPEGIRAIDAAIAANNIKMINFLIKNNCNIKYANLSFSRDVSSIEYLVEKGANPKTIDINFALTDKNNLKRLLKLKPNLVHLKLDFNQVFFYPETIDLLLKAGLDPNISGLGFNRCSLIYGAIEYSNLETVIKLEKAGANLKSPCTEGFSYTPLQLAVKNKKVEIVKYLLEKGADANQKTSTKESILSIAVNTDNKEIILSLINAGSEIGYDGYFEKTALMKAVEDDYIIAAKTLIDKGANVNYRNKDDKTPIIMAINEKNRPILKLLIENGANTNITYKSLTLVEYAESKKTSKAIIDYLKEQK